MICRQGYAQAQQAQDRKTWQGNLLRITDFEQGDQLPRAKKLSRLERFRYRCSVASLFMSTSLPRVANFFRENIVLYDQM